MPPPGPRSRELLERAARRGAYPGLTAELAPFVVARKQGWTVEDVDGNVYLDLISASASVPLGAGREDIIEPAVQMLRRYGNEDSHGLASELMAPLAERLLAATPSSLTRVDIALNGTEAVEIALKMMRRATGRPLILAFFGSYHGESTTTATLGAERNDISSGLRHLSPGFVHVPYPHPYRSPFGRAAAGRNRRRDGRLHPRPRAVPRGRPARRRRRDHRAGRRLGRGARPARHASGRRWSISAASTAGCSAPTR